jgi:ankyrin repeat protein
VRRRIRADRFLLNAGIRHWPYTAIGAAAYGGHLPIVRYLLDEGVEVNTRDGSGSHALRMACQSGSDAIVVLLLDRGADAATPGGDGITPLMWAAKGGHAGTIRALLVHGCGDIDARTPNHGDTALSWCVLSADNGPAAQLLLEAGADWALPDAEGWTPLALAGEEGHSGCVAALQVSVCRHGVQGGVPFSGCVKLALAWVRHHTSRPPTGLRVRLPPCQGPAPA